MVLKACQNRQTFLYCFTDERNLRHRLSRESTFRDRDGAPDYRAPLLVRFAYDPCCTNSLQTYHAHDAHDDFQTFA